jgi:hypothetical protein
MTRYIRWFRLFAAAAVLAIGTRAFAAQTPQSLAQILQAHNAWLNPPVSVEITGTAARGGVSQPIKITATRLEEVLTETGTRRDVSTSTINFSEDARFTRQPTPSGFAQLDVTGVFFLAHLARKTVTTGALESSRLGGAPALRLRARTGRSEVHYQQLKVRDEMDIYVTPSGLLAAIARSFYETQPRFRFTMTLTFSDYRATNGVLLPYRIERYIQDYRVETIIVERYAFDVATPSTLFEPRRGR